MSSIDDLAKALESAIGANSEKQKVEHFVGTGYEPLNEIISGTYDGGAPQGRLIEMYGPSSSGKTALATMMMVNAQKQGGVAGFFDHERSFNVDLAKNMGLSDKFPHWIYKQPRTWEESNMLMAKAAQVIREKKAIDPHAPIFFVFDSIAAALPKSVVDKDLDELNMNDTTALARVTSTTLKSMAQFAEDYNFTVLYLNQIRTKPGVVYGDPTCLRGDVVVPFTDGTSMTIREIVDNKIDKDVWSYNEETKLFEPRKIVNWFDNGDIPKEQDWIHIRANIVGTKNGVSAITVTPDHKIMTRDGWIEARDLTLSSEILTKQETSFNGKARKILLGMIAGDAVVRKMGANRQTAQIVLQDNVDSEYMRWKASLLAGVLGDFKETPVMIGKEKMGIRMDSKFTSELVDFMPFNRNPLAIFSEALTAEMLAFWIMDDGYMDKERLRYTVSIKRHKNEEYLDELADLLFDKYGLRARVRAREGALVFDADSSSKIAEMIACFVPDCMQRKLPIEHQGKYKPFVLEAEKKIIEKWCRISKIEIGSKNKGSKRYDIEVEGNHNYLVGNVANGLLVHNCTPGGTAMEFYATVRIALSRTKLMDEDRNFIGQEISMTTKKNKLTRPFQEVKLRMAFDDSGLGYFDTTTSLLQFLIDKEKLPYSKPRVTWIDGKQYFIKKLAEHIKETGQHHELVKILKS